MKNKKETKNNKQKVERISPDEQIKYLSRCYYTGKLKDWEYVNGCMVLKLIVYSACQYFGGSTVVRLYVPTDLEEKIENELEQNEIYSVVAIPYKVSANKLYQYRVDLVLHITKGFI